MPTTSAQHAQYLRRRNRTRASLAVNQTTPRLSVHRTLRHVYAQIIDDKNGKTLAHTSDIALKAKGQKTEVATQVGKAIANLALKKKIKQVRFDRGGRAYHGRIAAIADAARETGLTF